MLSRVEPSASPSDSNSPESFGPRCLSASIAARTRFVSGEAPERALTNPTIPHTSDTVMTTAYLRGFLLSLDAPVDRE